MRQEYKVIQSFTATAPISGTQKQFNPEEIIVCDAEQSGPTLTFETEGAFTTFFLVDRSVFEACCKWISRTAGSI